MMAPQPVNISTDVHTGDTTVGYLSNSRAAVSLGHIALADRVYEEGRLLQRRAADADADLIAAMLETEDDEI